MARPETPYEVVAEICRKIEDEGQNPSYGLVAAELPGNPSKGTVLKHIRTYKETRDLAATVDTGLSEPFIQAARAEIAGHITSTTETLGKKVEEATRSADEALAELDKSEMRAEDLEQELDGAKHLAEQYRQTSETDAAVASKTIQNLEKRVLDLEQERDQLIKAGELARTETAKAQMQVERADKAANLAEERKKADHHDMRCFRCECFDAAAGYNKKAATWFEELDIQIYRLSAAVGCCNFSVGGAAHWNGWDDYRGG